MTLRAPTGQGVDYEVRVRRPPRGPPDIHSTLKGTLLRIPVLVKDFLRSLVRTWDPSPSLFLYGE